MSQMNQITQQNASSSEELAATAEEMTGQTAQLQQMMGFFKTGGTAPGRRSGTGPPGRRAQPGARPADGGPGSRPTPTDADRAASRSTVMEVDDDEVRAASRPRPGSQPRPAADEPAHRPPSSAADRWNPRRAASSCDAERYLTFMLGGESFALNPRLKEIIEYRHLTVVPMMPAFIRGVINLRGRGGAGPRLGGPVRPGATTSPRRTSIIIVHATLDQTVTAAAAAGVAGVAGRRGWGGRGRGRRSRC